MIVFFRLVPSQLKSSAQSSLTRLETIKMTMTTTLIQTETSALRAYAMDADLCALLRQCAEEVRPQLDQRPEIVVYGKPCRQRRNLGFFSDSSVGYHYSTYLAASKPLTSALGELLDRVNQLFDASFNGVLVNEYLDGQDCIGRHSDSETGLDRRAGVVVLSVGAARKLRFRRKETGERVLDVPTRSDQMLQMAGRFQQEFTHEVPVEAKVKASRMSFTFRRHVV